MDPSVSEDLIADQRLVEIVTSLILEGEVSAVYVSGLGAYFLAR